MPPGSWEEDEWYTSDSYEGARHVPPRRRYSRGRDDRRGHLSPEHHTTVHMHRSRSQGGTPGTPRVTIYNNIDDHQRVSQSPGRGSPRGRAVGRLADELDDLEALEALRRQRSRSRGPLFHEGEASYERMQLELANERLREKERERREEEYKEMVKKEYEYKKERELRRRDEHEREEERERRRIIDEENLRIEKAKRDADDLRDRARAEWERKEREAKKEREEAVAEYERKRRKEQDDLEAERKAIIAEYENKKVADEKKAKQEEEAWRLRIKMEDEARKEKEKKEYEEFLLRQKQKEEEEKRKKKEEEDKLEEEMTKRLAEFGFQNNQIQAMIKPEKRKDLQPGLSPGNPLMLTGQPTYIKVHRDHIAIETLTYFDIPWEYDRVSSPDIPDSSKTRC
jgi:hypothetical protein